MIQNEGKRNHKDGIFRRLFHDKEALRQLYNALSGRNYPKGTEIQLVTLEDTIFGGIKNDLAFLIDNRLIVLIEHQATVNPNMPLRMLCYIAREYERYLYAKGIYSRRLVQIPTPELYVFYNGEEDQPTEQILKFSDAFMEKCDTISVELMVKVINVNYEKGAEILERCRQLAEYSRFIHTTRRQIAVTGDLKTALKESIQICMREGILVDFLKRNGGDVVSFLFEELSREECEAIREEDGYYRGLEEGERKGHAAGHAEGHAAGHAEGHAAAQREIAGRLKASGIPADIIAKNTGLSEEEVEKL